MSSEHRADVVNTPAIGITSHHPLGAEGRALVFQSFIPVDCTPEEMNALLDKVAAAGARQAALVRLPELRSLVLRLEKVQKRAAEDMFRIDAEMQFARESRAQLAASSGRRQPVGASAMDKASEAKMQADRANAETTFKRHEEDLKDRKAEIAELEKLTGG